MRNNEVADISIHFAYEINEEKLSDISSHDSLNLKIYSPEKPNVYASVGSILWDVYIYINENQIELIATTATGVAAATLQKWLGSFIKKVFSWKKFKLTAKGISEDTSPKRIGINIPWKDGNIVVQFEELNNVQVEEIVEKLITIINKKQLETLLPSDNKNKKPRVLLRYNIETQQWEIADIKYSNKDA